MKIDDRPSSLRTQGSIAMGGNKTGYLNRPFCEEQTLDHYSPDRLHTSYSAHSRRFSPALDSCFRRNDAPILFRNSLRSQE
ncbi:hypothetical protein GF406_20080 [candidate division KSB1 bacterium]|nr:hypothetical protein [candidate division KSB1 bacterium]